MNDKQKKIRILCLAALCLCAVVLCTVLIVRWIRTDAGTAEQKMLYTWDFTEGAGEFREQAYAAGKSTFSIERAGGLEGSACAKITNTERNDARYVLQLKVRPNTYYRISAWVRTQDVEGGSADGSSQRIGANLSALYTFRYAGNLTGTTAWSRVELYGRTAAKQTTLNVCLRLGFYSGDTTGTAWFDNVEVEQLSRLPEGVTAVSFADAINGGNGTVSSAYQKFIDEYDDTMLIGLVLMGAAFLALAVMYRYGRRRDSNCAAIIGGRTSIPASDWQLLQAQSAGLSLRACMIVTLLLALVLRLILSVTAPQCDGDVGAFQSWGNHILEDGIPNFYTNAEQYRLDYPPLYMYFLWFNACIARLLGLTSTAGYMLLVKLPSMLADCAIGYFIYRLCLSCGIARTHKTWTIFLMSVWLFNPTVLLDSAVWGQVESLLTLPLVLMVYCIVREKYLPAGVMLGLSILLKPQGIFLVPILGFAFVRKFFEDRQTPKRKTVGLGFATLGVTLGTMVLLALPFGIRQKASLPLPDILKTPNFFSWLVNLYINTANGYTGASVNSYNFWWVLGKNWTEDAEPWLFGKTYFWWGMAFIVLSCLLALVLYMRSKRVPAMPFMIASMIVYAVTMFGPRMHERYFFPCLALLLVAVVYSNNRLLLYSYGAISAVNFMSVLSVMIGMNVGRKLEAAGAPQNLYGSFYWPGFCNWPGFGLHRHWIANLNLWICVLFVVLVCALACTRRETWFSRMQIWSSEELPAVEEPPAAEVLSAAEELSAAGEMPAAEELPAAWAPVTDEDEYECEDKDEQTDA